MMHGGNVWQGPSPDVWLDFSANLRPDGAPDWVVQAMARGIGEARYYPDVSMRAAKEGLAAYAGVRADCVLPLSGGIAAIDAVCRAGAGRVLITPVTFGEYARRARACGREVLYGRRETMKGGDTLFLCNPNNPTGLAREREEVLQLYAETQAAGATLIVDEAFIDYCPQYSVRREAARESGLIVLGSLTKALCIPGARLGYLIAQAETVARLEAASAPWGLNAFAAAIARELPGHLSEIRAEAERTAQRRARFAAALYALGATVYPSQANFLLADFGRPMGGAVAALREAGILVRDCASFGLSDAHLRLAVKTDTENARLLEALKEILR